MKQAALDLSLSVKKTRKREFLEQMDKVVPWAALVELIAPYYPEGKKGRPPFSLETMLRTHFLQQWFTLSDPGMEEAFFDTPLYREFAQLEEFARLPDESTILRFRHRLAKHKLAEQILATVNDLLTERGLLLKKGTVVDATLIPAPSSTPLQTKNRSCNLKIRASGCHTSIFHAPQTHQFGTAQQLPKIFGNPHGYWVSSVFKSVQLRFLGSIPVCTRLTPLDVLH